MIASCRNLASYAGTSGAFSIISRAASILPIFLRILLVIVNFGVYIKTINAHLPNKKQWLKIKALVVALKMDYCLALNILERITISFIIIIIRRTSVNQIKSKIIFI